MRFGLRESCNLETIGAAEDAGDADVEDVLLRGVAFRWGDGRSP